ncbi:MAG: ABC transporter ATP-binding protein [Candidatus Berkelbacteria bacterium]|nr:ABC transporter ATP-binding protein [Candidatus Berkelbacteria bacterium]
MSSVIKLKDITKVYKTGEEDTIALKGINLRIEKGEFVAIMGPSGSGKSTLMHIIGLLDKPTKGTYILEGKDVSKINSSKQSELRNKEIGFVFQQFSLLPRTTVFENVLLPTIYGDSKNAMEKAKKVIAEVGLSDRISHKSNQLSGGQIQRVAVARALIMNPSIILADEPTGNLDSKNGEEIMRLFQKINEKGATIVLITHEATIAKFAKRTIELKDGQII